MSIAVVVCATDFSDLSMRAANVAARIAAQNGARLSLLHVAEVPELSGLGPSFESVVADDLSEIRQTQDRFAEASLRALVSTLRAQHDVDIESALAHGHADAKILDHADKASADLLVLGHHGAGAQRLILGSVAARVIRSTPISTLVVPAAAGDDATPGARVLAAVELDPNRADTVGRGALELTRPGSRLELFHAFNEPALWSLSSAAGIDTQVTRLLESAREAAADRLEMIAAELEAPEVELGSGLEVGSPPRAILARADVFEADLIAVGTHKRQGIARLIGTCAERVLRHSEVPVLLVPVPVGD